MYCFAMDVGWKRIPMLLILLIFLKHAFGQKGWSSHDVLPHQKRHDHKIASPRGAQSSVLEAPVTGSIPLEEVASNVLAEKSLNASRSHFSLSRQYVKGGISSSHASMSHTQSAPSSSVSASSALPQNLLAASHQYVPTLESSSGSSSQPQGTTSQYAPIFSSGAKVPVSSQYNPATLSGSSQSLSQSSQKWQPSTSRTEVFQPSSTAVLQGFQTSGALQSISQYPSRFVSLSSASADGSSLQLQGTSSQYAPALDAKVPVYRQAAPSGLSLPTSKPSQWQPSTSRWSQGFQASGTMASQSSSPTQGYKSPSRFSTLTSASPGQSFSNVYTSSSLSRAGAQLAGSSRDVPVQTGSTTSDGSSLQLQGISSQYAPASLFSKVLPYKPAAPSGSSFLSQPSQWQPSTSRWSQGFQASGTVASQSSSPSQDSKSPSRFSTTTSDLRSELTDSTTYGQKPSRSSWRDFSSVKG